MTKQILQTLAAALVICGSAAVANAQFQPPAPPNYGPGYRPQLSPYLNLLRGGDPAANYYLGTLPEFQRRSNAQTFSTEINDLDRRTLGNVASTEQRILESLPGTGHPTAFGTTMYYFGTSGPYSSVARRAPANNQNQPAAGQRNR